MSNSIPEDRIPVIVGVGEIVDRPKDIAAGLEPLTLLEEALKRADEYLARVALDPALAEAFAEALHRIQVRQLVPGVAIEAEGVDAEGFAQRLRPEVVQLWYQMALNGRRDLSLAPSPRAGFEMSVLRMLAFRPAAGSTAARTTSAATASSMRSSRATRISG